ncbi:Dolichyl-diphosphooligosaccharide--protein glycosyltransferase subunit Swp1 [Chytridium lagenaria]|nr:Dolichyl-diphosphooligosaccharide--protein glycosyltransferase subunit Swp1 [Chytridium lagenaria]
MRSLFFIAVLLNGLVAVSCGSIKGVNIRTFDKDKQEKDLVTSSHPNKAKDVVNVDKATALRLHYQLNDDNARYAFLTMRSKEHDKEATLILEKAPGKAYVSTIDVAAGQLDVLRKYPGMYSLDGKPILFPFADVKFNFRDVHENSEDIFSPLPLIEHKFREPEKTPNPVVSYTFAILVLAPWWAQLGANISNLFASVTNLFWGASFIVALAFSLVHFGVYWTSLNLFEFLRYGTPLWLLTLVTGRKALVVHATIRQEDEDIILSNKK